MGVSQTGVTLGAFLGRPLVRLGRATGAANGGGGTSVVGSIPATSTNWHMGCRVVVETPLSAA